MAIAATAEWRIRAGGAAANGGGYDPGIAGAATDYTDQDAAQLSLSDLATSGAGVTTLTSATGGFTAAMIGNCIRISAGTNFDVGYYFITAHTNTNTVTVDRTPSAAGAGSAGVGKLGGAFASFENLAGVGNGGLSSPAITSPLAAGHTVWVRGAGTDTPTVDDFNWTGTGAGYWSGNANGNSTAGRIQVKGYNGRPQILYGGVIWYQVINYHIENIKFKRGTNLGLVGYGIFDAPGVAKDNTARNLRFDMNGIDAVALACVHAFDVFVDNTGVTTAGTKVAIDLGGYGARAVGCFVKNVRGDGFGASINTIASFEDCIAKDCKRHGFSSEVTTESYKMSFRNCIAYGNGSSGFYFPTSATALNAHVQNCIAYNNGAYGIAVAAGSAALNDRIARGMWDYNFVGANVSSNYQNQSAGANDVALSADPFTDAANDDFSLNNTAGGGAACRAAAFPGAFRGSATTAYKDGGAVQHQDAGGGSGGWWGG